MDRIFSNQEEQRYNPIDSTSRRRRIIHRFHLMPARDSQMTQLAPGRGRREYGKAEVTALRGVHSSSGGLHNVS